MDGYSAERQKTLGFPVHEQGGGGPVKYISGDTVNEVMKDLKRLDNHFCVSLGQTVDRVL
eukprot:4221621-Prymnesium_polylepis.1